MMKPFEERTEKVRVLLVDDESAVRDAVYILLDSNGYEVLAATSGPEGLTAFHRSSRPIDLVVTDCQMPGMSGLELARACARRNHDVAVLYMSGSEPDEELQTDIANRRRAFVEKPFRGDDLLRRVRELLAPGPGFSGAPQKKHEFAPQLMR